MQSHEHMLVRLMPGEAHAVDAELLGADGASPAANVWTDRAAVEVSRGRNEPDDFSPRSLPAKLAAQLLPNSFEHAADNVLNSVLDLTRVDARFTNDATGAPAYRRAGLSARRAAQGHRATAIDASRSCIAPTTRVSGVAFLARARRARGDHDPQARELRPTTQRRSFASMLRGNRCVAITGIACAIVVPAARAQAPQPKLAQLAHRAWTARDGAPSGNLALAQTRDGYLWLGGSAGLFRFDGVRFQRYEPPAGQELSSNVVNSLLALPDGTLWVGYSYGGASAITRSRLVNYGTRDGLPEGTVTSIALDSAGTLWLATTRGLAKHVGDRWQVVGAELGYPGGFTTELTVDRRGTLWVVATAGIFALSSGSSRFVQRAPSLVSGAAETGSGSVRTSPDGSVWSVSLSKGISRLTDADGRPLPPAIYYGRDRGLLEGWVGMFIDLHGYAWGLITHDRLVRVRLTGTMNVSTHAPTSAPSPDVLPFNRKGGASGNAAFAVLEDFEGDIWVASEGGVDQLRAPKFNSISIADQAFAPAIVAADDGGLWGGTVFEPVQRLSEAGVVPTSAPGSISVAQRDLEGEIWVGGLRGVWHARGREFESVALPSALRNCPIHAIARERDGTLWVSGARRGVFRRRAGVWSLYGTRDTYALSITADSGGRIWLGYADGRLVREGGGETRVFTADDELRVGSIRAVAIAGRRVWVTGELGVAVMDEGTRSDAARTIPPRFVPVSTTDGPLRSVSGIVSIDGDVWLNHADGVTRFSSKEVERVLHDSSYRVRAERFDARDRVEGGVDPVAAATAVRGVDGRVWVARKGMVGWIDPTHIRRNLVAPPVAVRALVAAGRSYRDVDSVRLPQRTTSLDIAYTGLSLSAPEKVQFRYRLVGLDTAWQDAGPRREAFFTNLRPGTYRFEVSATNEDGVSSVRPATLEIAIPPTFVQTEWFRALCVAVAVGALWAFVVWRNRRVARTVRAQSDAVLAERLRVARELHDTLLSDMAGMTMRLEAATAQAERAPEIAIAALPELRNQARRTLTETRAAVTSMRATAGDVVPLGAQVADAAHRMFADTAVRLHVRRTGTPRRFDPAIEGEVLRIVTEALVNAHRHAACRVVTLTCAYERRKLDVIVEDDGTGFDAADNARNGRGEHWGLVGMRERASSIGAEITITSTLGRGTRVALRLPYGANIAR